MKEIFRPTNSKHIFRSSNELELFIALFNIQISFLSVVAKCENLQVLNANVTMLVGIGLLDKYKINVNSIQDNLKCYSLKR